MATATTMDKAWGQIVARTWQDESFKKRLLADPVPILKQHGINLSASVQVRILEDTAQVRHLTLPQKPSEDLSDDDLAKVAAGSTNLVGTNYVQY
jgi:hypothetical protein